jgi:hypothetical protein
MTEKSLKILIILNFLVIPVAIAASAMDRFYLSHLLGGHAHTVIGEILSFETANFFFRFSREAYWVYNAVFLIYVILYLFSLWQLFRLKSSARRLFLIAWVMGYLLALWPTSVHLSGPIFNVFTGLFAAVSGALLFAIYFTDGRKLLSK